MVHTVHTHYIYNLKEKKPPQNIGSKASKIRFLLERKCQTPLTYVCMWDAYTQYLKNDHQIKKNIQNELLSTIDLNKNYAIRSSANIEDGQTHSFAGQFKSVLNVQGAYNIMRAIETVWSSAHSESASSYLERIGVDHHNIKMAVIIQEMVSPVYSGISFSKNPMTGMDEIIVEAIKGSGDDLQRDATTPERWVHKWGEWIIQPDNNCINRSVIQNVVNETKRISQIYGCDIDLEWVYDGHTINWVQLREITSLKNASLYSNKVAKEVFPGVIKPLIWSVNVPLVCSSWVKLFTEIIGDNDIHPNRLAKSFYSRAYFNMGTIGEIFKALGMPANTIELMLLGMDSKGSEKPSFKPTKSVFQHLPRILRFAIDKFTFGRHLKPFIPLMSQRYRSFAMDTIGRLDEKEIFSEIKRLYEFNEQTAYYMIVTFLLMGLYNGLLKHQLKKRGIDFDTIDLTGNETEFKQYNPTISLRSLNEHFVQLDEEVKQTISKSTYSEFLKLKGIAPFQEHVKHFIKYFGHLSDSGNDFSTVPWRENTGIILQMIVHFQQPGMKSMNKIPYESCQLSPLVRLVLKPLYKKARDHRLYREQVSFLYTYGYGLFRNYFLALADHFVDKRRITQRDDIFFLHLNEIKDMVEKDNIDCDYKNRVLERKEEINKHRDIDDLPTIIYGDDPPPIGSHTQNKLKGTPTSKGFYKGPIRVVRGIKDFHKLMDGDVLAIPYSDVGWTPLFSRAGAIIAESGGFLSHSSIIARECGIPAIVSVAGACRLNDGTTVTVDAYQGDVIIHEQS